MTKSQNIDIDTKHSPKPDVKSQLASTDPL